MGQVCFLGWYAQRAVTFKDAGEAEVDEFRLAECKEAYCRERGGRKSCFNLIQFPAKYPAAKNFYL